MRISILFTATAFALAGCSGQTPGDGGNGVAQVSPSRIDPAELRAAVSDARARSFYEARDWQPAWDAGKAEELVGALATAQHHGLDPGLFLRAVESASAPAAREAALTVAALNFADTLARGRTDPARLHDDYAIPRPQFDAGAGLARAVQGDVAAWLAGLAPQDEEYRQLGRAYVETARRASGPQPAAVPDGPDIRPGGGDRRLPSVVAALRAANYLRVVEGEQAPTRYQGEMVAAVRALQEDYGLAPSGVIDDDTRAALNQGAADRARTLAVNLERRRWLARTAPATRIDVNTAAATLAYWREGTIANQRKVVVGEPGNQTPQLASPLYRLVANPTWTVPRSIQEAEIEPRGAGYMARNNMEWRDGWIVQKSGPRNSLGLVKFDMRNDQSIYLHDTPAKANFGAAMRQFSHGCVRVEDALGFAEMIAAEQGVAEEWARARAAEDEGFVTLPRPIPVRLLYHSAFVDGGRVRYRLDTYGWDELVARALGFPPRPLRETTHRPHEVSP